MLPDVPAIAELTMKSSFISAGICAASLAAMVWAGVGHHTAAQGDISFAGKTVTMTIGFEAGGGVDLYGRMLGRHLTRHLPGGPSLIVRNQLGAGGVVALNDWANKAEPSGLSVTIGAQSQIDPDAVIRTRAMYEPTTFNYVGGLAAPSQALFVNRDALKRLYDKSQKPAVIGVIGTTLRTGNYQALWGAAFLGWNTRWVRGYTRTSELRQAMERSEIDMTSFGSIRDIQYLLATDKFAVVSQSGTVEGSKAVPRSILGDAPIISDLVKGKIKDPLAQQAFEYGENVSQIGFWLALPPRTPAAIVATYLKAFGAMLKDARYQDEIAKIDPDSPIAGKADLDRLVRELAKVSPATLDYIQAELKRQGFGSTN
jgi:tripartite-type tricarboxylate transporter receptor subunit TctC